VVAKQHLISIQARNIKNKLGNGKPSNLSTLATRSKLQQHHNFYSKINTKKMSRELAGVDIITV
jgi:hypothetical protein